MNESMKHYWDRHLKSIYILVQFMNNEYQNYLFEFEKQYNLNKPDFLKALQGRNTLLKKHRMLNFNVLKNLNRLLNLLN